MRILSLSLFVLLFACDRGPSVEVSAERAPPSSMEAAPSAMEAAPSATPNPHADPHANLPTKNARVAPPTGAEAIGGVRWAAPASFARRAPSRPMRFTEYVVAGDAGEAIMTVSHFPGMGGTIDRNVDRWIGQFTRADGSNIRDHATVDARQVGGVDVTVVDVTGTFQNSMPMGSRAGPQEDQRLLGAIISAPEGPVFFKLLGPAATLEDARAGFDELIGSIASGS